MVSKSDSLVSTTMAVQVELGFLVDHSVSSLAGGFSLRILANFLILLGARTQKGQADDSKNGPASSGSLLQDAMGDSSGEKKPRNGHGTKLAPPPHSSPTPPPPSVVWCHSTKRVRGGRARPRATHDALHAVRSSRRSLSLRHNV